MLKRLQFLKETDSIINSKMYTVEMIIKTSIIRLHFLHFLPIFLRNISWKILYLKVDIFFYILICLYERKGILLLCSRTKIISSIYMCRHVSNCVKLSWAHPLGHLLILYKIENLQMQIRSMTNRKAIDRSLKKFLNS